MPGSIFARVEATLFTYAVSHMHCLYIWRERDVIKNLTSISCCLTGQYIYYTLLIAIVNMSVYAHIVCWLPAAMEKEHDLIIDRLLDI